MLVAGAWHEWNNHVPKLLDAPDFNEDGLAVLKQGVLTAPGPLNDCQWAALLYTEHMSRAVSVPENVIAKLKDAGFSAKEIVELTAVIASYNMVGRFFVALDIAEANDSKPKFLDF
jgi:alkylhydroperoxidase family enzyme